MKKNADQESHPPYRIFEHTADLGVEIYGTDERELFRNAGLALSDIMTDRSRVEAREEREIVAEGVDRAEVLVNFLREILYLYNGEGWLLKECEISEVNGFHLRATATGEPFAHGRHTMDVEIKAVTYHRAEVRRSEQGWTGRVICDV